MEIPDGTDLTDAIKLIGIHVVKTDVYDNGVQQYVGFDLGQLESPPYYCRPGSTTQDFVCLIYFYKPPLDDSSVTLKKPSKQ